MQGKPHPNSYSSRPQRRKLVSTGPEQSPLFKPRVSGLLFIAESGTSLGNPSKPQQTHLWILSYSQEAWLTGIEQERPRVSDVVTAGSYLLGLTGTGSLF